jgi:hypothetical protein
MKLGGEYLQPLIIILELSHYLFKLGEEYQPSMGTPTFGNYVGNLKV